MVPPSREAALVEQHPGGGPGLALALVQAVCELARVELGDAVLGVEDALALVEVLGPLALIFFFAVRVVVDPLAGELVLLEPAPVLQTALAVPEGAVPGADALVDVARVDDGAVGRPDVRKERLC